MAGKTVLAYQGRFFAIEFLVEPSGAVPAQEFLDQFGAGHQQHRKRERMKAQWQIVAETPPGGYRNGDQFKKVTDDLFEFRAHQLRVLCFFEGRRIILVCGEQKKTGDLSKAVIERAKRLRDQWRLLGSPKIT